MISNLTAGGEAACSLPTRCPIWTSLDPLTRVGQCRLEGGADSITNPVTMNWSVGDEGEVEVILPAWPGIYPYTFAGEVQPNLGVYLDLSTSAMCLGTAPRPQLVSPMSLKSMATRSHSNSRPPKCGAQGPASSTGNTPSRNRSRPREGRAPSASPREGHYERRNELPRR